MPDGRDRLEAHLPDYSNLGRAGFTLDQVRLGFGMHRRTFSVFFFAFSSSIALAASPVQERADQFLRLANAGFQALFRVNAEAQWTAVTDVTPAHDAAAEAAGKAFAAFNGNTAIITETRDLLTHEKELTPITVRQLKNCFCTQPKVR
jgi:hypothetical protein